MGKVVASNIMDGKRKRREEFKQTSNVQLRMLNIEWTCQDGGAEGIRTPDPHNAIVVLYQLSYDPIQSGENLRTYGPFVKANCRTAVF